MKTTEATNDPLIYELLRSGRYQVCFNGQIQTRVTKQGHLSDCWRYVSSKYISFTKLGKHYKLLRNRIVYQALVGPLKRYQSVSHKDGNLVNNHPDNLELVPQYKVNERRFKNHPAVIGNKVLTWDIVRTIRRLKSEEKYPHSRLAREFGISKGHVSEIVNNHIWIEGKEYCYGKNQRWPETGAKFWK